MDHNEDTKLKVAVLETKTESLEGIVHEIRTNHLPHIYDRLGDIEKKIAYYVGGAVAIMAILQITLKFLN